MTRLGDFVPGMLYKQNPSNTWGAGGNTSTITDAKVTPSSIILVQVTGSTPQAGYWSVQVSAGSFVITSTDAESSTLPFTYVII